MADPREIAIAEIRGSAVDNVYHPPTRNFRIPAFITKTYPQTLADPKSMVGGATINLSWPAEANTYLIRELTAVYGLEIYSRIPQLGGNTVAFTTPNGAEAQPRLLAGQIGRNMMKPGPQKFENGEIGKQITTKESGRHNTWTIPPFLTYFGIRAFPLHHMISSISIKTGSSVWGTPVKDVIECILRTVSYKALEVHGQRCFGTNAAKNMDVMQRSCSMPMPDLACIQIPRNESGAGKVWDGDTEFERLHAATSARVYQWGLIPVNMILYQVASGMLPHSFVPEFASLVTYASDENPVGGPSLEIRTRTCFTVVEPLLYCAPFLPPWMAWRSTGFILPTKLEVEINLANNLENRIIVPRCQMFLGEEYSAALAVRTTAPDPWTNSFHKLSFTFFQMFYVSRDPQPYLANMSVSTAFKYQTYNLASGSPVSFKNTLPMTPMASTESYAKQFTCRQAVISWPNEIFAFVKATENIWNTVPTVKRGLSYGHIVSASLTVGNKTGILTQYDKTQLDILNSRNNVCHRGVNRPSFEPTRALVDSVNISGIPGGKRHHYDDKGTLLSLNIDETQSTGAVVEGVGGDFVFELTVQAAPNAYDPEWGYTPNAVDSTEYDRYWPADYEMELRMVTRHEEIATTWGTNIQRSSRLLHPTEVASII